MKSSNWIRAHNHAFDYLGGVTETLVPDNLKTGVTKNDEPEPILNEAYREIADYYRNVIVPARGVVKHKDKPSVEGSVGLVLRQIIANLRNTQCFYLEELNDLIWKKLHEVNNEPIQKKKGSRRSVFEEEETPYLHPLR